MPVLLYTLPLLLLAPLPALAVTVFDDGGVHVIDAASDAVEVLNETTVLTVPGAEIVSVEPHAVVSRGDSAVGIFGGSVVGGSLADGCKLATGGLSSNFEIVLNSCLIPWASGIDAVGGTVTVASGEIVGCRSDPRGRCERAHDLGW